MSKIILCDCTNTFQDERYGQGKRYHTTGEVVHRCSVCGKEKAKAHEKVVLPPKAK